MSFTQPVFARFLLITLSIFYAVRSASRRRMVLLLSSCLFYGWFDMRFLALFFFTAGIDFYCGQLIYLSKTQARRKLYLLVSLVSNFGVLGFFKYYSFFRENADRTLELLGVESQIPLLAIILPIGLSFYTFQSLSYTIDIYFGKRTPVKSALDFFTFVAFFPQLVAGPIVRSDEFLPQMEDLERKRVNPNGIFLIFYGLFKKIVLADSLARLAVEPVFGNPVANAGFSAWLGMYAYAFQIFLDFSAYSDIAIGAGQLFGFQLPENFRSPYHAEDPQEFWRRWHISFSRWIRDYLYIPLGGNRGSHVVQVRNLVVTMFLAGLWHGAAWTFVWWGLLHGAYLVLYRWPLWQSLMNRIGRPGRLIVWFHLVCFGWILFRAGSFETAISFCIALFTPATTYSSFPTFEVCTLLALSWIVHSVCESRRDLLSTGFVHLPAPLRGGIVYLLALVFFFVSEWNIGYQAFIYFQF